MASGLFDLAAERLEHRTALDRLEARGTLRLAFKQAGLDPKNASSEQLDVLFERVLPGELEMRGVDDVASVCRAVLGDIANSPAADGEAASGRVDDIFRRLGGD
jgi:hypothetical protein